MSESDESVPTLDDLVERDRVARVLFAYADHVDRAQVDPLLALFTTDARFDFGFGRVFEGHEQLGQLFERLALNEATSHHVSNVVVDVEGDEATARSAVYAFHRRAGTGDEVHLWGRYTDRLVRVDGAWLFRERVLRAAAERGLEPEPGRDSFYEPIPRTGG